MFKTIGSCGFVATGSSVVTDLLLEFEETQVFDDIEFTIPYAPDGLDDLRYHISNYSKFMTSVLAIKRFRRLTHDKLFLPSFIKSTDGKLPLLADDFLDSIIQVKWNGYSSVDNYSFSVARLMLKRICIRLVRMYGFKFFIPIADKLCSSLYELSVNPEDFDIKAKEFICAVLDAMGRDDSKITVLDQPFEGCNPVKSFKYFNAPGAIVVNRDPRDWYLFIKLFLSKKMGGKQIATNSVDNFIRYYRAVRQEPVDLRKRDDILFMNFESFIYDYDNSIDKVKRFAGISKHTRKREIFEPSLSRNNTQLFKKFGEYEDDIVKIANELPEYLFPFDDYLDIEAVGKGMFMGKSPLNKKKG